MNVSTFCIHPLHAIMINQCKGLALAFMHLNGLAPIYIHVSDLIQSDLIQSDLIQSDLIQSELIQSELIESTENSQVNISSKYSSC